MRVLITNNTLANRAGSELYVRDVAFELLRRGHRPVAYSTVLGEVAEELRSGTVPVVDDLDRLAEPPDVIHGQHHLETMAALTRFPGVPAVSFCHGWVPVEESPVRHPRIRRWVAMDETTRDRLVAEGGVPPALVTTVPNFVDLRRFRPGDPPPERPRRALVFANEAQESTTLPALREACRQAGLRLEVAGHAAGRTVAAPEERLRQFDVVFARGRSALEAMAVGAAVVVCDGEGALGGFVTPDRWPRWRPLNFGLRCLDRVLTAGAVVEELGLWDPEAVAAVSARTRAEAGLGTAVDGIVALYEEAVAAGREEPADPAAERDALVRYLVFLRGVVLQGEAAAGRKERRYAWLGGSAGSPSDLEREVMELRAELARVAGSRSWRLREQLLRLPGVRAGWRALVGSDRRR